MNITREMLIRAFEGSGDITLIIGEAKRRASTDDDVVKDPINREKKVIEIYQSEDNTVEEIGRRLVGYTSTYDDTTSNMQGFVGYQLMPGTYLLQKQ